MFRAGRTVSEVSRVLKVKPERLMVGGWDGNQQVFSYGPKEFAIIIWKQSYVACFSGAELAMV